MTRLLTSCHRSANKPRVPSLVVRSRDEQQHSVEKRLKKKCIKCNFDIEC